MRRQIPLFVAVIALACAGGQSSGGATAGSPSDRQKITNLVPFDVATCFPSRLDVGKTANAYTLQAAFRGARPIISECLVDGRNQPAAGTKGKATITLDGSAATVTVAGDGLQPPATNCIENAIRAQLEGVSTPAGKPMTFVGPFERDPRDAVHLGVNDSSDVIGSIRLALPQWCNCFDGIKARVPPELGGSIDVVRAEVAQYAERMKEPDGGVRSNKPVIAALTSPDPAATQTVACLSDRINSMSFKITTDRLTVPAQFLLVNSGGAEAFSPTAPPPLQFAQLDAVRDRRESEAFAALARRQQIANAYDVQVDAYQAAANSKDPKKRKSAGAMVKELKGGCATLIKADDEYARALETEMGVEQQAVTLAQGLKAKEPQWADAEKASAAAVAETQKQIDAAKQLRAANEKACPKEKY